MKRGEEKKEKNFEEKGGKTKEKGKSETMKGKLNAEKATIMPKRVRFISKFCHFTGWGKISSSEQRGEWVSDPNYYYATVRK
jgi:hypothetical protein